jgi:tryptophanase
MRKAPSVASYVAKRILDFTPAQREAILKKTDYNVFNFPAAMVAVDLLTDSGTAALMQQAWGVIMMADESYARNVWYYPFLESLRNFCQRGDKPLHLKLPTMMETRSFEIINEDLDRSSHERDFVNGGTAQLEHPNTFLLPQGRCCESILFTILQRRVKSVVPERVVSNGLFDTTKANVAFNSFEFADYCDARYDSSFPISKVGLENPFFGNMSIPKLKMALEDTKKKVPLVVMTLTNNTCAGQPVSMANLKETRALCTKHDIPLWIDGSRIAENAAFIKRFEPGYSHVSIPEILRELFSYADGFHISLKKGLCNIGGVMCFRHGGILDRKYPKIGHEMKELQIITYGNDSYGGCSGRDIAAATIALSEVTKESYLFPRLGQTEYLAAGLAKRNVPVVLPPGGHAVYIDVNAMFPEHRWDDFMGVSLTLELLRRHGVRACELGYMAWELDQYVEKHGKMPDILPPNFVRLAIPANVYHKEHIDYVIDAVSDLNDQKHTLPLYTISRGKQMRLRHFVAGFQPKTNFA